MVSLRQGCLLMNLALSDCNVIHFNFNAHVGGDRRNKPGISGRVRSPYQIYQLGHHYLASYLPRSPSHVLATRSLGHGFHSAAGTPEGRDETHYGAGARTQEHSPLSWRRSENLSSPLRWTSMTFAVADSK